MMTFYSNLATTADRLLAKYGQVAVLSSATAGAYDPSTGSAALTVVTQNVKLVVFSVGGGGVSLDQNTDVLSGSKMAVMSAIGLTVVPKPNDKLVIGTQTWTVQTVAEVSPSGSVVAYNLYITF